MRVAIFQGVAAITFTVAACGTSTDDSAPKTDTKTATATATAHDVAPIAPPTATATDTAITATVTATATSTASDTSAAVALKLEGKHKQTLFGKTIYLEDKLYTLSCNEYFMKFILNEAHPTCTAVTSSSDFVSGSGDGTPSKNIWSITSPDGTVNIAGEEISNTDRIKIGGTDYLCYLFDGDAFSAETGDEVFGASHVVLAKLAADRPSKLKPEDVYAVFPAYADFCDALR